MPEDRTIEHGYIKLFRKFFDSEFWHEERVYSKAEAWIDLIEMSRYGKEDKTLFDKRGSYVLGFGDIYISERFLAKRWIWSTTKVRKFLGYLEKKESIKYKIKSTQRSIINLMNLDTYLGWNSTKESAQKAQGKRTKSAGKAKKKTVDTKETIKPDNINAGAWNDFVKYRNEVKKELTPQAMKIAFALLGKYDNKEQKQIIEKTILNGWIGLFDLKGIDSNGPQQPEYKKL